MPQHPHSVLSQILTIWSVFSRLGVHPQLSVPQRKEIITFNKVSILTFLVIVPYLVRLYWFFPETRSFYELGIFNALLLLVLLFNHLRLYVYAQLNIFFVTSLMIFWGCCTFGLSVGIQFAYILVTYGVILYTSSSRNLLWLLPILLSFFSVIVLYYTNFRPFPQIYISPELINNFTAFNLFTFLTIGCILSYMFSRNNAQFLNKIRESNQHLEHKNQELEKLNAELDRFVYSVSHDLRSPIASVLGLISLSKEETDIQQLRHYLDLKEKSMLKLDGFIRDILDYSRNTRVESKVGIIDFKEVITNIFQLHDPEVKNVKLEKHLNVEASVPFEGDTYRLGLVLNNLISNSIRYYNPSQLNPMVSVHVKINEVKAEIEMSDNGIGIGKEHLDKIFNMFYRASSHSKGSGLGLYIVREAITKMNGSIRVTSTENSGTTFFIEIPNMSRNIKVDEALSITLKKAVAEG